MKIIIYNLLILSTFLFFSCATEQTVKYTIASEKGDCVGMTPQECLLIKKGETADWEYFYGDIEGFNHEPGYEYVIEVKEEPLKDVPADASEIKYVMTKEISKTAKTSENLPVKPTPEYYQCVGRVVQIQKADIGKGGAAEKISATVVEIFTTSSAIDGVKEGDKVYCELIATPSVEPMVGKEYVFKAKNLHPAHAKGVYLLETDVLDLTR